MTPSRRPTNWPSAPRRGRSVCRRPSFRRPRLTGSSRLRTTRSGRIERRSAGLALANKHGSLQTNEPVAPSTTLRVVPASRGRKGAAAFLPRARLRDAHILNGAPSFPSLLGKVARRAGWGMARPFDAGRIARTSQRTALRRDPAFHTPSVAFGDTCPASRRRGRTIAQYSRRNRLLCIL